MPSSQAQPCTVFDTTIYDIRHLQCNQQSAGREFICEKSMSNGNLTRENYMNKSNQSLCNYNASSSDHIVSG